MGFYKQHNAQNMWLQMQWYHNAKNEAQCWCNAKTNAKYNAYHNAEHNARHDAVAWLLSKAIKASLG